MSATNPPVSTPAPEQSTVTDKPADDPRYEVQDQRRFPFTMIDNDLIEHMADIGIHAYGVYSYLAKCAGQKGSCNPAQVTIAKKIGISERTVRDAFDTLVAARLISVTQRHGYASTVTLLDNHSRPRQVVPGTPAGGAGLDRQVVPAEKEPLKKNQEKDPPTPQGGTGAVRYSYSPDFEEFWQAYPKGHGSKKVSFDQWKKLGPIERAMALDALDAWKRSERWTKDGGKYVKDCERYLSQRMFEVPPGNQNQMITPLGQETDDQRRGRVPWYQKHPKTGDVIDVNKLPHNSGLRSVLTGVPIIG